MYKKSVSLTDREYKVMEVLWNHDRELTVNEISELSVDPELTVACVAQVIPRLLKKELIHVEKFIPVNTKYARTFRPDITREDYTEGELQRLLKKSGVKAMLSALVHIHDPAENEALLEELETFTREYREQQRGKSS